MLHTSVSTHLNDYEGVPVIKAERGTFAESPRYFVVTLGNVDVYVTFEQLQKIASVTKQAIEIEETIPFDDEPEQEAV